MNWVYFIQHGGPEGHIKIGTTTSNPYARLRTLQTGAPEPLVLLAAIPGNLLLERELHERFAAIRTRENGEWFHATPELLAFIEGAQCGTRQTAIPRGELDPDPSQDHLAVAAATLAFVQATLLEWRIGRAQNPPADPPLAKMRAAGDMLGTLLNGDSYDAAMLIEGLFGGIAHMFRELREATGEPGPSDDEESF